MNHRYTKNTQDERVGSFLSTLCKKYFDYKKKSINLNENIIFTFYTIKK